MSKHTPGPWTVSELDARGEVSEYHIFIEPNVAVIERKVAGHDQNDMADAHLIAAAPAMLEALEMAVRQNEHDMLMTGEELRAARAALGDKTPTTQPPSPSPRS